MTRRTQRRLHLSNGPDRWMISWADLLTLLFASVVVLYASAARRPMPDHSQARQISIASDELADPFESLAESLQTEVSTGAIRLAKEQKGVVITLNDGAWFESGSDRLTAQAVASLGRIALVLQRIPNDVQLEGHSDSIPIHNDKFRDNWALSTARAGAVLNVFEFQFAIPARRLSVAGFADNHPLSPADTSEGRALNRRVDIVVLKRQI